MRGYRVNQSTRSHTSVWLLVALSLLVCGPHDGAAAGGGDDTLGPIGDTDGATDAEVPAEGLVRGADAATRCDGSGDTALCEL